GMDGVEDPGVLGPQAGELRDVEEAAVVDLLRSDPPVGQTIDLLLEQGVQVVEGRGGARRPPERRDVLVDELAGARALLAEAAEPALDDLLLPPHLLDPG